MATTILPPSLLSSANTGYYAALSIVLAVAGIVSLYRWALPKPIPGIPYDKAAASSIFGNMRQLMAFQKTHKRFLLWFAEQARQNGWPISQVWLGPFSKPVLILSDFTETENVLLRKSKDYGRGQRFTETFANVMPEFHVALEKEDPKYNANKGLLRDTMKPSFLNTVSAPQIYQKSNNLIDLWRYKLQAARGRPFNALQDIFSATSDMIAAAAYAVNDDNSGVFQQLKYLESLSGELRPDSTDEHDAYAFPHLSMLPYVSALTKLSEHIGELVQSLFPRFTHYYMMLTDKELREAYEITRRFEKIEIEKSVSRMDTDEPMISVLDHMMYREKQAAANENRTPDYHRRGVYDELTGYYQAGFETSATTLSWAVKFLAQNPQTQNKLREALRRHHTAAYQAGRQPAVEEIISANVDYLNAVIDETLRMRPPFAALNRCTITDTEILGCRVPKGTTVIMPSIGPGLHTPALPIPNYLRSDVSAEKKVRKEWASEDIHLFKAERWLRWDEERKEAVFDATAGPMQSFGYGPRQCFGKRLGYLQLRTLLTLLVWNFKFRELEGTIASEEPREATTLMPVHCYVKLEEA